MAAQLSRRGDRQAASPASFKEGPWARTTRRWLRPAGHTICSSREPHLLGKRSKQAIGSVREQPRYSLVFTWLETSVHPACPCWLGWPHSTMETVAIRHESKITCLKSHHNCSQIKRKSPESNSFDSSAPRVHSGDGPQGYFLSVENSPLGLLCFLC